MNGLFHLEFWHYHALQDLTRLIFKIWSDRIKFRYHVRDFLLLNSIFLLVKLLIYLRYMQIYILFCYFLLKSWYLLKRTKFNIWFWVNNINYCIRLRVYETYLRFLYSILLITLLNYYREYRLFLHLLLLLLV